MGSRRPLWMPLAVGLAGLAVAFALRPLPERANPSPRSRDSAVPHPRPEIGRSEESVANPAPAAPSPRPPRREKEFYNLFRKMDAVALDRTAAGVLAGNGPENEKVALLKALRDDPSPEVLRHFATALHAGPTLADVAAQFLSKRAASDPVTRAFLESQLWDEPWTAGPELRRKTVRTLFTHATPDEASRLSSRLMTETDGDLVADVAPALRRFGLFEGLAWSHPDAQVRARLEAMRAPAPCETSNAPPEAE